MEMLYSPRIKLSPPSRAWAGMRMVSASRAWLGEAAGHRVLCNAPRPFLPTSVSQPAGAERRKSEGWLREGVFPPTPPNPSQPHSPWPKPCRSVLPCKAGAGLLSKPPRGVHSPPAAPWQGTQPKTCPFCPTLDLS